MARRRGGRNKGFWYRANRGWYVTEGKRSVPLCDEGGHLKDRDADPEKAYARYLIEEGPVQADGITVERALRMYLTWLAKHGAPGTYAIRKRLLDDFSKTYGPRKAAEITALDVQDWADAHPNWTSNRAPIQALRRAFNFCVLSARVLKTNPVSGIKVDSVGKRVTYFSPEAEEAMYANAKPALAIALRVCIRTGAPADLRIRRPGSPPRPRNSAGTDLAVPEGRNQDAAEGADHLCARGHCQDGPAAGRQVPDRQAVQGL